MGAAATPAIQAQDLHRFYHSGDDETQALRAVSLTVWPGEFVVVIGPSGSGKSTLLSCLTGLDEPDGGTVHVAGRRLTRRPESERARIRARSIGILTQTGNLLDHLTVRQNVHLARQWAGGRTDPEPIEDLLSSVGLESRSSALPETLSGGETVRAGLAVALANEPPVLVADEPTGELDSATERTVLSLLHARAAAGTAVLVATHSAAVMSTADRVLTLDDGQVRR